MDTIESVPAETPKPKRVRPSRAKPKAVEAVAPVVAQVVATTAPDEAVEEATIATAEAEEPPIAKKASKPRAPAKSRRISKANSGVQSDLALPCTSIVETKDEPPPNPRENFVAFVSRRLGDRGEAALDGNSLLSDIQLRDIEIGIFNWSLEKADERRIPRNWNNPRFYELYMSKARSVASNLVPDSYVGNDRLTHRIKDHEFNPHEVVTMSSERVCPERWQTVVDAKIRHDEYISTAKPTAMTDQFLCGRCKKRECSFMELQTRSCDEPASIFVCCLCCGHRWRMG